MTILSPSEFEDLWRKTRNEFDISWTEAWNMIYEAQPEQADAYLEFRVSTLMPEIDAHLAAQDPPFG